MATKVLQRIEHGDIRTPRSEDRQHRYLRLHNGLQVMLVSDQKCDKAAAALSVRVGSLFDPKDIQGLAHFCEHMLFMGSKKYPEENYYSQYLTERAGDFNAWTSDRQTCYHFDISPEHLASALDVFAQFFLPQQPLFAASSTEREMNAVHSEHNMRLQSDARRQFTLLRSLSNPAHPFNHYGCGNLETLRDIPEKCGLDVRTALLAFHSTYYSSNIMTLSVIGKEQLDQLEQLVVDLFLPVEDKKVEIGKGEKLVDTPEKPFRPEDLGKLIHIVPVSNYRSVTFEFILPEQTDLWRSKPTSYISHLLGHEGKKSLLSQLKLEGLATELSAGCPFFANECGIASFGVCVMTTEKGMKPDGIERIGDLLFSYIRLLLTAAPPKWVHDEVQNLARMNFTFLSKPKAQNYASVLATSLHDHPPEEVLGADYLLWEFAPELIEEYLKMMTDVDKIRLIMTDQKFSEQEDFCTEKEHFFGTKYHTEPLPPRYRERWIETARCPNHEEAIQRAKNFGLGLPTPNPFVPSNLEVYPGPNTKEVPALLSIPTNSPAAGKVCVYHLQDSKYLLPKADVSLHISSPEMTSSLRDTALLELFLLSIKDILTESTYDASVAGLNYDMYLASSSAFPGPLDGVDIRFSGYSETLPVLYRMVLQALSNPTLLTRHSFDTAKTILTRNLQIMAKTLKPVEHLKFKMKEILQPDCHSFVMRLSAVESLQYEDLLVFVFGLPQVQEVEDSSDGIKPMEQKCHLFKNAFIEMLIQGNFNEKEALSLVEDAVKSLGVKEVGDKFCVSSCADLNNSKGKLRQKFSFICPNPEDKNSATRWDLHLGTYSVEMNSCLHLVVNWLGEKFFDTLRTKKQLGYMVSGTQTRVQNTASLTFYVQSAFPLEEVRSSIDAFLRQYLGTPEEPCPALSTEDFELHRRAVITRLEEEPKKLSEEVARNYGEVISRRYDFDRRKKQVEYLKKMSLLDFHEFVIKALLAGPWTLMEMKSVVAPEKSLAKDLCEEGNVCWEDINEDALCSWRKVIGVSPLPVPAQLGNAKLKTVDDEDLI